MARKYKEKLDRLSAKKIEMTILRTLAILNHDPKSKFNLFDAKINGNGQNYKMRFVYVNA